MSPRIGRPKAKRPKSKDIKVRIDEDTLQKLDAYCKKQAVARAEAIRTGISLLLSQN